MEEKNNLWLASERWQVVLGWLRAAGVGKKKKRRHFSREFPEFVVNSVKVEGPLWKTIKQTVEFPN